jgi:phytoene dehydrogenase-like protein
MIAAAYLSRAGLRTAVVERRHEVGGGLATEETLFPGFYTNPHAIYHLMVDYMPALRDLDLGRHGVTFVKPNVQLAGVFPDGTSLVLCRQTEDSKDSIAKFSPKDARAYGRLMRSWRRAVEEVLAPGTYLPAMAPVDMIEALERTAVGREVLRLTEMSPREIVEENFENDRVRMLVLYAASMWGLDPEETGLGFLVPLLVDRAVNKAICYGGSHRLAGSLSREILQAGGTVLDNAEVTRLLVEGGRVAGVELFDGRVMRAKAVLSSLPPALTFGRLLDPSVVPSDLADRTSRWEWDSWSFLTVSVATKEWPWYETDDPWVNDAVMTVAGFGSTDDLLAHWRSVLSGDFGATFGGHATVETRYDPTLPRVPGHDVAFFQVHAPYDLRGGWEARREELTERVLATWRDVAPSLTPESIVSVHTETPVDIETRLASMVRGSIKHGAYHSLQMGVFRPHESCAAGRTPIEGLYLCGASAYPGGLVTGGPGYIAAGSVADDMEVDRWWTEPLSHRRYRETYLEPAGSPAAGGGGAQP